MVFRAVEDKKGERPVVLDLRGISSVTDILVVCSGHSDRHVQAVAENIYVTMKHEGIMPLGVEGMHEGRWALLDYDDIIVHVFHEPVREFYDLEGVWRDAPRLDLAGSS
ncbi:MAG: ribosome silencing factor [Deltaproteobacteria bacterium]|nr:ribosome silencing factor [Candidatus Anaeroferrophillus wilburensis]MBN2889239.1 ribosome silencing factor [Deltaproteobacteria bacterium]